jgi:hypothetical protein
MIYSRWNPVKGGYDYLEGGRDVALGDDLPKPVLSQTSAIGVASLQAGRDAPSGARYVGSGVLARGAIVPMSRGMLGSLTSLVPSWALWIAVGLGAGWYLTKRRVL